jgi:hypothetical protein
MKTTAYAYDFKKYNFPAIIADLMEVPSLENLSYQENEMASEEFSLYKNMEQTPAYKTLYEKLNNEEGRKFFDVYERFIKEVIQPKFEEQIYFQQKPTHRILYKDAPGVSRFHRDRQYGHNPDEINFFLPLTPAFDTNTLWIESEEGKEDFEPLILKPGEFVRFDGANLMHGAKVNETGKTRVSFDFRVIPASKFEKSTQKADRELDQNAHFFAACE